MTFTSWQFGVFVAIVFAAYYLPALRSFQVQLLVFASLFFYGYGQPELLALLAVAVFGTYLFLVLALRSRQVWLPVGVVFNLALLALFKYKLLFIDPVSPSLVDFAPLDFLLKLPLPNAMIFFLSSPDERPPYGFMLLPGTTSSGFAMNRSSFSSSQTKPASFIALENP